MDGGAEIDLVTGGAGFIGSHLAAGLAAGGRRVRVLDNLSTGRRSNVTGREEEIELIEGDVRDANAVRSAMRGVRRVFHLAALPSVEGSVADPLASHDVNVNGTLTVLVAARDAGVRRFVFASSAAVYGNEPTVPKREDMLPQPLSPYAVHKLTGEHYCRVFRRLYGLSTYALRYFNVFGTRQDPASDYAAVIPSFVESVCSGGVPRIHGDGEQTRDFVSVRDVVRANMACCTAPDAAAGDAYNIAGGTGMSINALARRILGLMGSQAKPAYGAARPGDVRESRAAIDKARTALGWTPRDSFDEALSETIRYFMHPESARGGKGGR